MGRRKEGKRERERRRGWRKKRGNFFFLFSFFLLFLFRMGEKRWGTREPVIKIGGGFIKSGSGTTGRRSRGPRGIEGEEEQARRAKASAFFFSFSLSSPSSSLSHQQSNAEEDAPRGGQVGKQPAPAARAFSRSLSTSVRSAGGF